MARITARRWTEFVDAVGEIDAIGHRVVHGGAEFVAPTRIDATAEHRLQALGELAPLHNPPALEAIRATMRMRPATPNVACFDTAFHASLPAEARTYALPAAWVERWGLRRFGFHGLSHAYASRRAAELLGRPIEELRLVTAHLGAGASLAAIQAGRSIDTTMGFTPLEGLVMATRSGSVDPGLILWLQQSGRLTATEVEHGLEHAAGLLGISGQSGDMRAILAGVQAGDENCRLAFDVYSHRLASGIAAMAASLGAIDALVFTGGVGENRAEVRAETCRRLAFLGLALDEDANRAARPDCVIADGQTEVPILVVGAREDLEIAAGVRVALGTTP